MDASFASRLLILIAAVLFAVAACCFGGIFTINGWTFISGGVSAFFLAWFFGWPWHRPVA